jgi:hypothetical protein
LLSLADPSAPRGAVALPAGHPFLNISTGLYWSSTVANFNSAPSFLASFVGGSVGENQTDRDGFTANVWCVRGPGLPAVQ